MSRFSFEKNSKGKEMIPKSVSKSQIWNRVGYVEIYIWTGRTAKIYKFEGHDIKFKVTHVLGRLPEGNASISICNLTQDTANEIITICSIAEALRKRKTIKLYAGYADPENANYKGELIATMDIINATISTPPPDIWLEITAVYAAWLNNLSVSFDFINLSGRKKFKKIGSGEKAVMTQSVTGMGVMYVPDKNEEIIEEHPYVALNLEIVEVTRSICKKLTELHKAAFGDGSMEFVSDCSNLEPNDIGKCETPGKTFHLAYKGTMADIPTKISEAYKVVCVWEERGDGKMYLVAYPDPEHPMKTSSDAWRKRVRQNRKIKFLDVDLGLIGIPKLKDSINLQCRCYLDGKLQCGDYVSIRSEMVPAIYEAGEPIIPNSEEVARKWDALDVAVGDITKGLDRKWGVRAFQIMKITYSGHLRGNHWCCDIEARRPYLVENRKDEIAPLDIELTEDVGGKLNKDGWDLDKKTGRLTRKGWVML